MKNNQLLLISILAWAAGSTVLQALPVTVNYGQNIVYAADSRVGDVTPFNLSTGGPWTLGISDNDGRVAASTTASFSNATDLAVFAGVGDLVAGGAPVGGAFNIAGTSTDFRFVLTESVAYSLVGNFEGSITHSGRVFLHAFFANTSDFSNPLFRSQPFGPNVGTFALNYASPAQNTLGSTSGVLGPGEYYLNVQSQILDTNHGSGGPSSGVVGDLTWSLSLTSMGNGVPVPDGSVVLCLAATLCTLGYFGGRHSWRSASGAA